MVPASFLPGPPDIVHAFAPRETRPGSITRVLKAFTSAPDGSAACYPIVVIAGAAPGPTAALVAGIHGDEYEGPRALFQLMAEIRPAELRGRLVIVPIAHLAAFGAGTRTSLLDGANLARIFPGDAHGTVTQRLAYDLFETVIRQSDFLVDLHSGGTKLDFLQVAGWYGEGKGVTH